MAKLINRYALFDEIRNITYNSKDADAFFEEVLEVITEQPTTTESEIRAKAIDEFAEETEKQLIDFDTENGFISFGVCLDIISKVAEQLKEE